MRPLIDDELRLRTLLVTPAEDQSRLVSEFVRAAVRKLQNDSGIKQQQLALTVDFQAWIVRTDEMNIQRSLVRAYGASKDARHIRHAIWIVPP